MPRVLRGRDADADIAAIAEYIGIEKESTAAARRFIHDLNKKFLLYAEQPEMGEPRTDLAEGLRSFPFKKTTSSCTGRLRTESTCFASFMEHAITLDFSVSHAGPALPEAMRFRSLDYQTSEIRMKSAG